MLIASAAVDGAALNVLNGLARGLLLFTIAGGLSVVFGTMNLLNLAHGSLYLAGGYVAVQFATGGDAGFGTALVLAAVIGAALGLLVALVARPVVGRGYLPQALVTLGIGYVMAECAYIVMGNDVQSVDPPTALAGSVSLGSLEYPVYRLAVIVAGVGLAVGLHLVLSRTILGAQLRAAVADRAMLSAVGVNVDRLLFLVLAGTSALAAIGGVLAAPVVGVYPGLNLDTLVLALLIVVIGGLGSLRGALIAALLVGQTQTTLVAYVPGAAAFALFGVMTVALLAKPNGLFSHA